MDQQQQIDTLVVENDALRHQVALRQEDIQHLTKIGQEQAAEISRQMREIHRLRAIEVAYSNLKTFKIRISEKLLEFIENERHTGVELHQAVINAGEARLRPVLLTAATAIAGLLSLAF
ncbi:MAG: hypothetical protein K2X81_13405, partial [Candidatus Obscuribacterales bacterium]|nr:hypothetical protein [Candidatus Obscuribacterales bacterium]